MNAKKIFQEWFPVARDVTIFAAAALTMVFNYFAAPVREDIRANARKAEALDSQVSALQATLIEHENESQKIIESLGGKIDKVNDNLNTKFTILTGQVGKLEGRLSY